MLGRVFGNLYGLIGVAAGLSYLGGGLLLDATSAPVTFVIAGAAGTLITGVTALCPAPRAPPHIVRARGGAAAQAGCWASSSAFSSTAAGSNSPLRSLAIAMATEATQMPTMNR